MAGLFYIGLYSSEHCSARNASSRSCRPSSRRAGGQRIKCVEGCAASLLYKKTWHSLLEHLTIMDSLSGMK